MLARGARLGTYEVLEPLGAGGMGEVFRAHDSRLGRDVALKVLSEPFKLDSQRRARFEREARVLASLNHPNIATLHGLEESGDTQALVLELVAGATLRERIAAGPIALDDVLAISQQIAAAMEAAHEHGVVHRDLKPENIKLRPDGTVKLLDFGLAKVFAPESEGGGPNASTVTDLNIAEGGAVVGTLAYMSPEQARGLPVDKRTDIWAFGCLLYEMLTGKRVFVGERSSDIIAQIIEREPDLSALPSDTPGTIRRLLRRCLAKDPRQRLRDIGDARFELARAHDPDAGGANEGTQPAARNLLTRPAVRWASSAAVILAGSVLVWMLASRSIPSRSAAPVAAPESSPGEQVHGPSIAVLPFVNMSGDADQEYFSDGLTEELINQLTHIDGLHVTARTSAFAFKGRSEDLRAVGETLGVAHILEGSVRKSGGRIRVTAELINAADGYHLWSDVYERKLDDVFAIQDEIAAAVAAKLGPTLGIPPRSVDYGGTTSFEAYDHLLRGGEHYAKASLDEMRAASDEYRSALAIDPSYARAAAELAITWSSLLILLPRDQVAELARARDDATHRAIELAPRSPLTLAAKMWWHADHHEWLLADDACAAVFAAQRDPRAELFCSGFLNVTGRARSALPYREAAHRADPLAMSVAHLVARQYSVLDKEDELVREYERTRDLPGSRWDIEEAMFVYLMHHRAPPIEIADRLERACTVEAPPGTCPALLQALRSPAQAVPILRKQLDSVRVARPALAVNVAYLAVYLRERDLALEALDVFGHGAGAAPLQRLWFPLFGELRKDPRFKKIISDIGYPTLWRKAGWADFCRPLSGDDFECF